MHPTITTSLEIKVEGNRQTTHCHEHDFTASAPVDSSKLGQVRAVANEAQALGHHHQEHQQAHQRPQQLEQSTLLVYLRHIPRDTQNGTGSQTWLWGSQPTNSESGTDTCSTYSRKDMRTRDTQTDWTGQTDKAVGQTHEQMEQDRQTDKAVGQTAKQTWEWDKQAQTQVEQTARQTDASVRQTAREKWVTEMDTIQMDTIQMDTIQMDTIQMDTIQMDTLTSSQVVKKAREINCS